MSIILKLIKSEELTEVKNWEQHQIIILWEQHMQGGTFKYECKTFKLKIKAKIFRKRLNSRNLSTMGYSPPYYYPVEAYLNRIAISTLKVDGWQLSMTSKKSNWLWGKQVVDEGADPADELSTTLLWTAFTLHAFIWSLGRKFTGFLIRLSLEVIARTRSQVTNFLKNI